VEQELTIGAAQKMLGPVSYSDESYGARRKRWIGFRNDPSGICATDVDGRDEIRGAQKKGGLPVNRDRLSGVFDRSGAEPAVHAGKRCGMRDGAVGAGASVVCSQPAWDATGIPSRR